MGVTCLGRCAAEDVDADVLVGLLILDHGFLTKTEERKEEEGRNWVISPIQIRNVDQLLRENGNRVRIHSLEVGVYVIPTDPRTQRKTFGVIGEDVKVDAEDA